MSYEQIPAELRALPQWVAHKSKCPYDPRTGYPAKARQPETWATFNEAVTAAGYDGIGFEFMPENGLVGVDLDTVRDPETGWTDPLALEIIDQLDSYTEISPSGYGFHIIARGTPALEWNKVKLPANQIKRVDVDLKTGQPKRDKDGNTRYKQPEIEMYTEGRYFTMTGNVCGGYGKLAEADTAIAALQQRFSRQDSPTQPTPAGALSWDAEIGGSSQASSGAGKDYLAIGLEKDSKFRELWDGHRPHGNESADDQALMNKLAYWCSCSAAAMMNAFKQSPHCQQKDPQHMKKAVIREDYLQRTVEQAVKGCTRTAEYDDLNYQDQRRTTAAQDFGPVANRGETGAAQVADSPEPDMLKLTMISAADLQNEYLPPIQFIVQGLLPQGSNMLASPPKYGKSWFVLDLGLAVAEGTEFLGRKTQKCGVLYLALEDSKRRLKSRMNKLLNGRKAPDNFYFATDTREIDNGLLDELSEFIKKRPDTKLIIIDTLQKVRSAGNGKDVYGKDYRDVGALKKFADENNLCILLVHHLRKMGSPGDPFERISGTNGILGAVDTSIVMTRESRSDEDTLLSVVGRDVDMQEIYISFDKESCRWSVKGDADWITEQRTRLEYQESPIVKTIKKLLEQGGGRWDGSMKDLLTAGQYITQTYIDYNERSLSNSVKKLEPSLFNFDGIIHERTKHGSGGGKHRFYYAALPQDPIELDPDQQEEIPFSP